MGKRTTTTRQVALLYQLFEEGQLILAPEFQRNSVWPQTAKAYLVDTILEDKPIPPLFFQRATSSRSGRPVYSVVDGQQRLRAVFQFLEGRFKLSKSELKSRRGRSFEQLSAKDQDQIRNYDFLVEELVAFSENDINDIFVRMNRYVVKLSPQELRNARHDPNGAFARMVQRVGAWEVWTKKRVFSAIQVKRMRPVEFAAELLILLAEGPQDKKTTIDLYYGEYRNSFPDGDRLETRLQSYVEWIGRIPNFEKSRFRRPVDLYSLVGALDEVSFSGKRLRSFNPELAGALLDSFERKTRVDAPTGDPARYLVAASRQTDNITPRNTRIAILEKLLVKARRR